MKKMTKVAAAVSVAIGTAGMGVSQADEFMFGYVVSSPTVTTVLSLVNREIEQFPVQTALHWEYFYKAGAAATDNSATCIGGSRRFSSSPNDLVSVSVDEHYGSATRGILFNDPMTNATYAPTTASLALLKGLPAPVRAFTLVDNNDNNVGVDGTLTAGRATILEFINGAAWGYAGYNALGQAGTYNFDEEGEVFGEVFGPDQRLDNRVVGVDFSYKPFSTGEFTTMFFVTPIDGDNHVMLADNATVPPAVGGNNPSQERGNLVTNIRMLAPNPGDQTTDVTFDRDENLIDGVIPQNVVCVGAVTVESMMSGIAANAVRDTGGWSSLLVRRLGNPVPGSGLINTDEAMIMFLEHNGTGGTFNGEPINGVVNNGYMMNED